MCVCSEIASAEKKKLHTKKNSKMTPNTSPEQHDADSVPTLMETGDAASIPAE